MKKAYASPKSREKAEAAWIVALRLQQFGYAEISSEMTIPIEFATHIVQAWNRDGRIRVITPHVGSGRMLFEVVPAHELRIVAAQGDAHDQMWTAMRKLGSFSPVDIAAHCAADVSLEDARAYEPSVEVAMTRTDKAPVERPLQHEFDAAVSFHFNTGAIRKATWVKLWKAKAARLTIQASLMQWNKGGGKVLPGLTYRREREGAMLLDGVYPRIAAQAAAPSAFAKWGLSMSGEQIDAVREALRTLGYEPGKTVNAVDASAARKFQADHDLTVDGIIGRATLTTLQRQLDARRKVKAPAAASVASVPVATTDYADQIANLPNIGPLLAVGAVLWLAIIAYRYRDIIAAEIQSPLPRVAALLRSF